MTTPKTPLASVILRLLLICLCLQFTLHAAPSKLESSSPFLPPGYSDVKPTRPTPVRQNNTPINRDIEFRGVVQINGIYQISLFKKSENRGYWISEDSSEHGIRVDEFNMDSMSVTVVMDGRSEQLSLMESSGNPLPVASSNPKNSNNNAIQTPNIPFPSNVQTPSNTNTQTRRTIPRRRVIVPPQR